MVISLAPGRYYLDSNIFIYAVEPHTMFTPAAQRLFNVLETTGYTMVTSELALSETLVKPIRDQDDNQIALYEGLIRTSRFLTVVPVDRAILKSAAALRAVHKQRLPDAIDLATALAAGCEVFVSQDDRVRPVPPMTQLRLDGGPSSP